MKTYMAKASDVQRKWYVVDAEGMVLGRLASQVASILRGKNKPTYTPHVDTGDHVIILNADKVVLTGNKLRGTKGSVVATIASCLPPFLIILLVAMFFTEFKDNEYVLRAFKGIRPVVVALIGVPLIDMIRATRMRWWSWCLVIGSMTLVCFMKVSPIYILICVIVVSLALAYYNERKRREGLK